MLARFVVSITVPSDVARLTNTLVHVAASPW